MAGVLRTVRLDATTQAAHRARDGGCHARNVVFDGIGLSPGVGPVQNVPYTALSRDKQSTFSLNKTDKTPVRRVQDASVNDVYT